jgi:hypothetical protein
MRKLKHLLAIAAMVITAAMFLPSYSAVAQPHTGSCHDDDPNCPGVPWQPYNGANPNTIVVAPGCTLSIDIFYRDCHGQRQFRYGAYTTIPNGSGQSNCYLYSTSTLTQLIDLYMIQNDVSGSSTGAGIPLCEQGFFTRRYQFWSASCYALQHCTYTYNCDATINCDIDPGNPPFPPTFNTWDYYRWLPCGTTCCQRIYEICEDQDGTVEITSVSTTADRCTDPPGYGAACQPACDW